MHDPIPTDIRQNDRRARLARAGYAGLILGLCALFLHAAGLAEPRAGWLDATRGLSAANASAARP